MADDEGAIGGRRRFPATRPTIVEGLSGGESEGRREAFDQLVRAYWEPVYLHLRWTWRRSDEDARDLTQAFFLRAIEKETFSRYDSERSRFRSFIRLTLDAFVQNEGKAARARKRGGGALLESLDFDSLVRREGGAGTRPTEAPDALFERHWRRSLLESARLRLGEECRALGREDWFRLYVASRVGESDRPSYDELAGAFALPVTTVTNRLNFMRREMRRHVLEALRAESPGEEAFREDLRALLGDGVE